MVHSTTVNQYNSQYDEVKRFIMENNKSSLLKWLQWWDKRQNHVMDAYRDVSAPNTNLAEVSHASTTHCGGSNLNLIQTAVFDISDCFKYAQAVKGYFSGVVKAGSGPSYQRKQMILEQKANSRAENLLHELDDQFKGGKATQLPTTSTFMAEPSSSHRADKSSDKDKRPI
ncbi:SRGAP [Mytilus coruscus]|uniref:SRGAP n=1 Tax=Mytilus coruscus TaxID=42192 RepID=A0A6J8AF60_MYTCO|nr:SRGAP [Mytilus coruscus]